MHHTISKVVLFLLLLSPVSVSPAQQPNVLLIISDDLNTRIGPYMEIDRHTPNLDRLANEGVRFERAYCQYPVCGPSRASLMSGLYPETNGVLRNSDQLGSYRVITPALADHPSIAGLLRQNGYFTARTSKIFHMGVPGGIENGDPGGDDPDSWDYAYNVMGPETLSDGELELLSPFNHHYGGSFVRMILDNEKAETQTDYIATSQAIAILESRAGTVAPNARNKIKPKSGAPFFLAVGLVRPHVPLIAPENCFEPYPVAATVLPDTSVADNVPDQALNQSNSRKFRMTELQQKKTISAYMASVRFMDQQVGRLLDALDRLELRDNTIVIFISDHGYNLGEHSCWAKGTLWEGEIRVPMIISHPGHKEHHGNTCSTITEFVDFYPTIAELCGLEDKKPEILQGKSLVDYIVKADMPVGDFVAYTVTNGGKSYSIRTNQWRYTRWDNQVMKGNEELYDHDNDPEEHNNLAYHPEYREVLVAMRELLDKKKKQVNR